MTQVRAGISICVLLNCAGVACADDGSSWTDPRGDSVLRRADFGNDGPTSGQAVLPDLLSLTIAAWQPASPVSDLYTGEFDDDAHFFRLDLVLGGVVNPPGSLGSMEGYDPFAYGPSPVYGYIELDVDSSRDSGGELGGVAATRFLANAARFGGTPRDSVGERAARFGADVDFDFASLPQYERSGAEFAIALCGCSALTIISQSGDMDGVFDAGETWIVRGRFLERFTAFNAASSMFGGSVFGAWNPLVHVRFSHDAALNETTVSLVFPLDQTGAGEMAGAPAQPFDFNVANQTSIAEALNELVNQPSWISGPLRTLSIEWKGKNVEDGLDPDAWGASAIVGTAYAETDDFPFVWTDVGFGMVARDFDGNGSADQNDETALLAFIASNDGGPDDWDGQVDGRVTMDGFSVNFAVYDTNYDGVVDAQDWTAPGPPADVNGDTVVDILDLLDFIEAFSICENQPAPCIINGIDADFNRDGFADIIDLLDFLQAFGE